MNVLLFLLIGLLAGWIAAKLIRGGGLGLIGDLVVGVIGAVIGGFLLGLLGIVTVGLIGELIAAVIGAVVFLAIINLFRRSAT